MINIANHACYFDYLDTVVHELAHVLQHEAEHHGVEFVATFEAVIINIKNTGYRSYLCSVATLNVKKKITFRVNHPPLM